MARKNNLSVQIVDPIFRKNLPDFIEPFDYDSRINQACCGAAHWIDYCKSRKWDNEQLETLRENSKFRVVIKNKVESILQSRNQQQKPNI